MRPGVHSGTAVSKNLIIYRQETQALMSGLNKQQPVERIAMQGLKGFYGGCVLNADWKRRDVIGDESSGNIRRHGFRQRELSQASFDGHLPDACRRQENFVA